MSAFRNPYLYIFGVPALTFLLLMAMQTPTDHINMVGRIVSVMLVGYIAARYMWRSVFLIISADTRPESFNLVGWSTFLIAFILATVWGAVFIALDRPAFMSSLYVNSATVILGAIGAAMIAWSIPRVGIFPNDQKGLSSLAAFVVGAGLMFLLSHAPQVISVARNVIAGIVGSVARAF